MTAFPNLKLKTVPGMDPILQFQATPDVPEGDLGIARVDVSVSPRTTSPCVQYCPGALPSMAILYKKEYPKPHHERPCDSAR